MMLSCSDSLSECGSIEIASPWSAKRKVAASAAVAPNATATIAAASNVLSALLMVNGLLVVLVAAGSIGSGAGCEPRNRLQTGVARLVVDHRLPVVGVDVERVAQRTLDLSALRRRRLRVVAQPVIGAQRLQGVLQRIRAG